MPVNVLVANQPDSMKCTFNVTTMFPFCMRTLLILHRYRNNWRPAIWWKHWTNFLVDSIKLHRWIFGQIEKPKNKNFAFNENEIYFNQTAGKSMLTHKNSRRLLLLCEWFTYIAATTCSKLCQYGLTNDRCNQVSDFSVSFLLNLYLHLKCTAHGTWHVQSVHTVYTSNQQVSQYN